MTGTLLLGGLVWLALAVLCARHLRGDGVVHLPGLLAAVSALPIALMLLNYAYVEGHRSFSRSDNPLGLVGRTRLTVVSLRVPLAVGQPAFSIGGDPDSDDLVVAAMPPRLAKISRAADGTLSIVTSGSGARQAPVCINAREPGSKLSAAFVIAVGGSEICAGDSGMGRRSRREGRPKAAFSIQDDGATLRIIPRTPATMIVLPGAIDLVSADQASAPRGGKRVVVLQGLGARFGPVLDQVKIVLPRTAGWRTYARSPDAPAGNYPNNAVQLRADDREIVLNVDPISLDAGLRAQARWLAVLTLIVTLLLTLSERASQITTAFIMGTVEILLTMRLVMAIDASVSGGSLRAGSALGDALVALPGGLLVVAAILVAPRRLPIVWACLVVLVGLNLFAISSANGAIPGSTWLTTVILFVLAILATAGGLVGRRPARGWRAHRGGRLARSLLPARFTRWVGGLVEFRLPARFVQLPRLIRRVPPLVYIAILLLLCRGALRLAGVQEAIWLRGTRVGLSILIVPVVLLLVAPTISRLARAGEDAAGQRPAVAASLLFFIAFGVIGSSVSAGDAGLGLVLFASLAVLSAAAVAGNGDHGFRVALPIAAILGLFGAWAMIDALNGNAVGSVLGLGLVMGISSLMFWRRSDGSIRPALGNAIALSPLALSIALLAMVPQTVVPSKSEPGVEANGLPSLTAVTRLSAIYAPSVFNRMVSGDAVNLKIAMDQLRAYTSTMGGGEFLGQPMARQLANAEFDDYLAAIHLISPFGRFGVAGFVLLLAALAVVACGTAAAITSARAWLGAAAAVTLTITSTYIILGNALQAPLTGRNVYLLAALSQSDLIEGLTLALLTAFAFGAQKRPTS